MKRGFRFGLFLVVGALLAVGGYIALVPKVGHASQAEIMAALPASLKAKDAPDPAGEARYVRLVALTKRLDKKPLQTPKKGQSPGRSTPENEVLLAEVEAVLNEGDLRVLTLSGDTPFPDFSGMKDAAKLIGLAAKDARERGNRRACGRWAALGLRLAHAMDASGGTVIAQLVDIAIDAIAVRAAYVSEINGGLDEPGRAEILAMLPPLDGRSSAMASAMRRDFQQYWMPVLLDPKEHEKELIEYVNPRGAAEDDKFEPSLVGTYDPLATAHVGGAVYDATIADLDRLPIHVRHDDVRLAEAAARGLPEQPDDEKTEEGYARFWSHLIYCVRMNAGRNTLGRVAASQGVLTQMGALVAKQAANQNLVRAVFLLRMGRSGAVGDPYSTGDLRIDRKRKIVWSVGSDGKDDGGAIGRGGDYLSPDLGYPYGDRSFHPNPSGPFRREPAGMPPPP